MRHNTLGPRGCTIMPSLHAPGLIMYAAAWNLTSTWLALILHSPATLLVPILHKPGTYLVLILH
jgi:hypothetical protein